VADAVLYFPYIRIRRPDSEWFTRVLLYWEKVGTIVPLEYSQDLTFLGPETAALIRHRLVEPIVPDGSIFEAREHYAGSFLHLIDNDLRIDRELPFERRETLRIHGDKTGTELAKALEHRRLARHASGPEWASWWDIDRRAAHLLMAYLAGVIGSTEMRRMDPITDSVEALSIFSSIPPNERGIAGETDPIRQVILEGVLPAPAGGVPPEELVAFKASHGDRLMAFRIEIERRVLAAASLRDERYAAEQARLDREELAPQIEELARRMSEHRWRSVWARGGCGGGGRWDRGRRCSAERRRAGSVRGCGGPRRSDRLGVRP
jgi:Family of unknown function (DUF6236)